MDKQSSYELGVIAALCDAGIVKESAMDPVVQKGMQQRRLEATAGGNKYSKGWSPKVPRTPTEKAYDAPSRTAGPPKMAPRDFTAEAGKKFKGVSGG